MSDYRDIVSSRTTPADPAALLAALKALDATAGATLLAPPNVYRVKKATTWTTPQANAAKNAIDTAPALTPQRQAQNIIDGWDIAQKALALTVLDRLNALGARVTPPIAAATPADFLAAIRAKAGTL